MPAPLHPSAAHVLGRVAALEARLVALVQDQDLETALVEEKGLLEDAERRADEAEAAGERVRLREVARVFELSDLQVTALLVAAAPDLDARFGDLCSALAADASVRSATPELVLRVADVPAWDPAARAELGEDGALLVEGLVESRGSGPALRRTWTVPPVVLDALLGATAPDPRLAAVLVDVPAVPCDEAAALRRAFDAGARLTYLRERPGGLAPSRAVAALSSPGPPLVVDLDLVLPDDDLTDLVRTALRDAQLRARGLVVGPVGADGGRLVPALRLLVRSGWPVVVHGARPWDPAWTSQVPVEVDVAAGAGESREQVWRQVLEQQSVPDAAALATRLAHLRLGSVQVVRAVTSAALDAAASGAPLSYDALVRGAQRQNGAGLERLARRVRPQAGPGDLVLPEEPRRLLAELVARFRHRDALRASGVGGASAVSRGVTALFGGPPGTGKTLAVEVLAHELGVDVYAVDLSTVVDKYVGETEKNLERIFTQAAGVDGVLFFDEADALFGRRGQVSEAKDRHANLGVAYLLQRLEDFDGLAVLATNLRSNLDEALARRIDVVIDFPKPDVPARRALFDTCLGPVVPRDPDLDLDALARFDLSGGEIRNVAVTAVTAVTATAAAPRPLTTLDLVRAVQQEYRKLGRLASTDFAAWSDQLDAGR